MLKQPHSRSQARSEGLEHFNRFLGGVNELSSSVKLLRSVVNERKATDRSLEAKIRRIGRWVQSEIKAVSEGTNSAGGALVPAAEIADTIIALRDTRGAFRAAASVMPMRGDTKYAPRRLTGITANFAAENSTVSEATMTWDAVGLVAKKIMILARISAELEEDAAFDVGATFLEEVAYAFAAKEDDCGFNGDGTSLYGGITGVFPRVLDGNHAASKVAAGAGHNTFATLDNTDLTTLMSTVPANAVPGGGWFVSHRGFALTFCRLAAAAGGITTRYINGVLTPVFLGFPVRLTQVMPQVTTSLIGQVMVAFGDLTLAATLGDRRDLRLRFSLDRYMDSDQVGVLGTERFDINVHDLGDNSTAGPVAALVGTA
jgi:HK97 family phage major capsid protein